jgi:hypothetical protein
MTKEKKRRVQTGAALVSLPNNCPRMVKPTPHVDRVNCTVNRYQHSARGHSPGTILRSAMPPTGTNKILEACMWKAGLVGAIAFATIGLPSAFADNLGAIPQDRASVQSETMLSQAQIIRLKSVLKLTQAQEQFWPAVEHAFREISAAQEGGTAQGLVQGIKHRATAVALNAIALRRLATAAYPLIRTLNEDQKQSALTFARSVGLDSVAAAF